MRIDIFDDSYPNHYNKELRCWVDVERHAAPTTRDDRCGVVGGKTHAKYHLAYITECPVGKCQHLFLRGVQVLCTSRRNGEASGKLLEEACNESMRRQRGLEKTLRGGPMRRCRWPVNRRKEEGENPYYKAIWNIYTLSILI